MKTNSDLLNLIDFRLKEYKKKLNVLEMAHLDDQLDFFVKIELESKIQELEEILEQSNKSTIV